MRYALRSQLRDWRYTAMIVVTLAVCIGANTAVFTGVHSVQLQPMPVPGADDIVPMANRYPKAGATDSNPSAAGDSYDRMREVTALEEIRSAREPARWAELSAKIKHRQKAMFDGIRLDERSNSDADFFTTTRNDAAEGLRRLAIDELKRLASTAGR